MAFVDTLRATCESGTSDLFAFLRKCGFSVCGGKDKFKRYAFKQGATATSPLIVCHADTVADGGEGEHSFSVSLDGNMVTSIALDDRLGVAIMLEHIATGGFLADCAFLVCDSEEVGRSTATVALPKLLPKISPNFLVELDRRGSDVVCYEYDTPLLRSLLVSCGFVVGTGSFSDICYLEDFGVVGFNVGIGYHNEHSTRCHCLLSETKAQLGRLQVFFDRFRDIRLDHPVYRSRSLRGTGYGAFEDDMRVIDPTYPTYLDDELDDDGRLWYTR